MQCDVTQIPIDVCLCVCSPCFPSELKTITSCLPRAWVQIWFLPVSLVFCQSQAPGFWLWSLDRTCISIPWVSVSLELFYRSWFLKNLSFLSAIDLSFQVCLYKTSDLILLAVVSWSWLENTLDLRSVNVSFTLALGFSHFPMCV